MTTNTPRPPSPHGNGDSGRPVTSRMDWTAIGELVSHVAHLAVAEHVIQDAAELRQSLRGSGNANGRSAPGGDSTANETGRSELL